MHPAIPARWSAATQLIADADALVRDVAPSKHWPGPETERDLAPYCYALGLFDQLFRTGPRPDLRIMAVRRDAPVSAFLELAPAECLDDLCALAAAARIPLTNLTRTAVTIGPSFAGSADVGGADADLVVDRCLIEIKTKVDPGFEQRTLHQALAYALLDYDDGHGIDTIAIYLARQARLIQFPLDRLLSLLTARTVTVTSMRTALKEHLAEAPAIARFSQ